MNPPSVKPLDMKRQKPNPLLLLAAPFVLGMTAHTMTPLAHAAPEISPPMPQNVDQTPADARAIIAFWREAGPRLWFAKDSAFDVKFRDRFAALYGKAARGELITWRSTPDGALAEILLLDQYPRNAFRGTPHMYATDALARDAARAMLAAKQDRAISADIRLFCYLPFGHSEDLTDQQLSVELSRPLGEPNLSHAIEHRDIVVMFGRFPHRNPILGRTMTGEEQDYLDTGGYKG